MSELSEHQQRNVELVRERFDAYNRGDIDNLLGSFHPELELHAEAAMLNSGTFSGHQGFIDWVTQWNEAWEDFQVEPVSIEAVGEAHVLVEAHQTGRGVGSGVPVEMDVFWAFESIGEVTTRAHLYSTRQEAVATIERWRSDGG